ncbi:DUF1576 domain-containing protein [Microaceticoccus formicicus]|uniref:DUF1576 domain-containing protein n=1 Tax=Microaceticoccus formicicus TaxID=3118105 RepID=UPI003CD042E1|nr:DUF1576 domain-containing protein [Peptoniphilaceae bacterium AMB_02]
MRLLVNNRLEREELIKYFVLFGFAVFSIGIGFYFSTPSEILNGLKALIIHHGLVDTDAFYIGGIGAAFVNSGLAVVISLALFVLTRTRIGSGEISGILMVFGYSFFGKTIFNMLPLTLGVYFYAFLTKDKLSVHSPMACYASAVGPIVSVLAFHNEFLGYGSLFAIIFGIIVGFITGILIAYFAKLMKVLIRGKSMYVGGFTAGVVAILMNSLLKGIGLGHGPYENPPFVDQSYSMPLVISMVLLFLYLIIIGVIGHGGLVYSLKLLIEENPKRDYVKSHGFYVAITSAGLLGLIGLLYFLIMPGAKMHGEMWAGIFTMSAFSVIGLIPRYIYPFIIGMVGGGFLIGGVNGIVTGGGFLTGAMTKIAARPTMMGTYVGSGISPVTEKFGLRQTIVLGLIYGIITPNLAVIHGWMNTYNSGFALGLVVILFCTEEFRLINAEMALYDRMNKYGFMDRFKDK